MPQSQTAICNMALVKLGISQSIADIDETSTRAELCRLFYDQCREEILQERPWPFAQRYVTLALVEADPNNDWSYSYRYPTGYLKLSRIVPDSLVGSSTLPSEAYNLSNLTFGRQGQSDPFELSSDDSGVLIFTNTANAIANGTYSVDDENQFNPLFVKALVYRLANELAIPLTKSDTLADKMDVAYQRVMSAAFANSQDEGQSNPPSDSSFETARN